MIDESRLSLFGNVYWGVLRNDMKANPHRYRYGAEEVPTIVTAVLRGIRYGLVNTQAVALKEACKVLGIEPTPPSVDSWFYGETPGFEEE